MVHVFNPALAEHTVFVVSVRNGSQLTGVPWDLRLAGHTSATHTFLVFLFLFTGSSKRTLFDREGPRMQILTLFTSLFQFLTFRSQDLHFEH